MFHAFFLMFSVLMHLPAASAATIAGLGWECEPLLLGSKALDLFDPSKVQAQGLSPLGVKPDSRPLGSGAFWAEGHDGFSYVFRLPSSDSLPQFERFANLFLQEAGVLVLETRLLSSQESSEVLGKIKQKFPKAQNLILSKRHRNYPEVLLSVTPYCPLPNGRDILRQWGASSLVRRTLKLAATEHFSSPDHLLSYIKNSWAEVKDTPEESALVADIQDLLPPFDGNHLTPENILSYIERNFYRVYGSSLKDLVVRGISRVPPRALEQLADYWALWTVLGITDFHDENWLMGDSRVLSIDLAQYSSHFERGTAHIEMNQEIPLGRNLQSLEFTKLILKNITSKMRSFLAKLDEHGIKAVSARSQFKLTHQQIQGMLQRARNLLLAIHEP